MSRFAPPITGVLIAALLIITRAPTVWADAVIGKSLFAEKKCMTCHKVAGKGGSIGPDLTSIGSADKGRDWHMRHLMDPKSVVPYSIMPAFTGSRTEAAHLVDYLTSLTGDLLEPQADTSTPAKVTTAPTTAAAAAEAAAIARNSVAAVPAPIPPQPSLVTPPVAAPPVVATPVPKPDPVAEPVPEPAPEIAVIVPVIPDPQPEEVFEEVPEVASESESRVTLFFPTGPEEDLSPTAPPVKAPVIKAPPIKAPPVKAAAPRKPAPVKKAPPKPAKATAKPAVVTPPVNNTVPAQPAPLKQAVTKSVPTNTPVQTAPVVAPAAALPAPATSPTVAAGVAAESADTKTVPTDPTATTVGADAPASALPDGTAPVVAAPIDTRTGKTLFAKKGCTSCHQINGLGGTFGPNLSREGTTGRTRDWHIRHLLNPSSVVVGSPMPTLVTDPLEAGALADYLMSLGVGDAANMTTAANMAVPDGMSPNLAHRYAALAAKLDDLQGRISHAAERGRNVDDLNVMLSQGRTHVGTLEQMVADRNVSRADGEVKDAEVVIDELTAGLDEFEHQLDERVWLAVGVLLMTLLGCLLLLKKIRLLTLEWQAEQAASAPAGGPADPAPALTSPDPGPAPAEPVPAPETTPPATTPPQATPEPSSGPSFLGSRSTPPVPPPSVPHRPKETPASEPEPKSKPKPRATPKPKPKPAPTEPAPEPEKGQFPRMKSGVGVSPNSPDGPVVKRRKKPPPAKKKGMSNAPRSGRSNKIDPLIVEDDIASDPGGPPKRKPPGSSS